MKLTSRKVKKFDINNVWIIGMHAKSAGRSG
jgi:hypothetical protein